jgi:gas vesicle protein
MARNDDGAGLVIMAFALGALAGAAVALLMAPTSGEEARRILADKAREGKDSLSSAVERGRQAYQQARGAAPAATAGEGL